MSAEDTTVIRSVLAEHGRLPVDVHSIGDDADLFAAGMTSHASVNLMLALEDAFDLEFPDEMLNRGSFESITAIASAIARVQGSDDGPAMGDDARS